MENKKFAWFPTKVTSGEWTWFKFYYQHRMLYDPSTGRPPINSLEYKWTETGAERNWRLFCERIVQNRNVWNDPGMTKKDRYEQTTI